MDLSAPRIALAVVSLTSIGCAAAPLPRPLPPLVGDDAESLPQELRTDAERADRICQSKEATLAYDYREAKKEDEVVKTALGSVTGGIGAVGGVIGGVGALVLDPNDIKAMTSVTGFISAGLGAVGGVVAGVVQPGKAKQQKSAEGLIRIDKAKKEAKAALEKKPETWGDGEKKTWKEKLEALTQACK
jgi:hypothetical protein